MTPLRYLKDKMIPLLMLLVALLVAGLLLWVLNVALVAIVGIALLLCLALCAALAWDYLSKRRFYTDLKTSLQTNTKAYYLSELITRPTFCEGELTFDAIERATKDMNDRIATYRLASDEYREYIESWIHEVKTPIASSKLTLANHEADLKSDVTSALELDLDRIEAYVEQALYYSRSAAVEKDYLIRPVSLDSVARTVVKKQARALIEHGITPHFEQLDYVVYTDSKWLDFIVGQIVANAIKYHRPQSATHDPALYFSAKQIEDGFETSYVLFSITDNGIGIPSSDVARVFEKGFTGENGRSYAKSTGIGLYLSKKLCDKMKLDIQVVSEYGNSTTITIRFPLSKMYFLT